MQTIVAAGLDALVFIGLAWGLWRLLGRSIPVAVIPIVIGLVLAATGWLPAAWGVPSAAGDQLGWIGVLLLAFTAGMETRHFKQEAGKQQSIRPASTRASLPRFYACAGLALVFPFAAGALVAHRYWLDLPGWAPPNGDRMLGAFGLGLCMAVSALPVLIGIVRELGPLHRPISRVAVGLAVIDDAVLWIGLALLLLVAGGRHDAFGVSAPQLLALAVPFLLLGVAEWTRRRELAAPRWAVWLALPLYMGAGAWASSQLGLHALLGAYFAGAILPPAWTRQLPAERIGTFALLALAPLFFGHSGLKIDGSVLGWASLQAALMLLALSASTKIAAVMLCPPASGLSRRESLAVGALLQCKGLMEIVAATILRDKGLLSESAFAALVVLAVLSTLLTGPLFHLVLRYRVQPRLPGDSSVG